jgi:hypothetical protein
LIRAARKICEGSGGLSQAASLAEHASRLIREAHSALKEDKTRRIG